MHFHKGSLKAACVCTCKKSRNAFLFPEDENLLRRTKWAPPFILYFDYMKSFILCLDLSGLGFLRGKNKTKVSNLASREFLPLSCMEEKEPGSGSPIHKLGTGSLLVMLVSGHQRLSQLITQQECGNPVTFPRGAGRKAATQKREENVIHFRR